MKNFEEWHIKSLRQLATINYGKSPARILTVDGAYPVVGTGGAERLGNDYLYDGDSIILGRKGTIDRVSFVTGRFWTIDTAYYLSNFQGSLPRWLFYFFQTLDLRQLNEATGVPSLSRELLYKIEVLTPPKPEQNKIAEILSTVDWAIQQTEALIAKQQRIKIGLMHDLLTRGIDERGNLRSEQTHLFKDSPLGRIPVEWEVKELRNYLSFLSYGFTNPMPDAKDGPYLVTAANVVDGMVQYEECRRTTDEAFKNLLTKKSRPQIGDILITKDGTLGRLALVDRIPLCINQSVAVLRPKVGIDGRFLKLLLESPKYQKRILDDAGGSTIKHIYISKLDKLALAIPKETSEQTAITERLQSQLQQLHRLSRLSEKLRSLKAALMQDMLTGKKRVTHLLEPETTY
jgi:type I restriction enzyme S subunit